jgi:hypothetical protein
MTWFKRLAVWFGITDEPPAIRPTMTEREYIRALEEENDSLPMQVYARPEPKARRSDDLTRLAISVHFAGSARYRARFHLVHKEDSAQTMLADTLPPYSSSLRHIGSAGSETG